MFNSTEVLNLRKTSIICINGKKKFKAILVEGEKLTLLKLPSKDFIFFFHNVVSEVFKGFKVHDFELYDQRNNVLKIKEI